MRRFVLLSCVFILLVGSVKPTAQAEVDLQDPMECYNRQQANAQAYWPLPHLEGASEDAYTIEFALDGISVTNPSSGVTLPSSEIRATMDSALDSWSQVTCASNRPVNLRLTIGEVYGKSERLSGTALDLRSNWDFVPNQHCVKDQRAVCEAITEYHCHMEPYGDDPVQNRLTWITNDAEFVDTGITKGGDVLAITQVLSDACYTEYRPEVDGTNKSVHPIYDADVIFNAVEYDWGLTDSLGYNVGCGANKSNCYDLETVAVHELGHAIGFGHVQCTQAVMYTSYSANERKRELTDNEIAGVCAVYGPFKADAEKPYEEEVTYAILGSPCDPEEPNPCTPTQLEDPLTCVGGHCRLQCTSNAVCQKYDLECLSNASPPHCGLQPATDGPEGPVSDWCTPCNHSNDCFTGLCVQVTYEGDEEPIQICSAACSGPGTCGPDAVCVDRYCVPSDRSCVELASSGVRTLNEACDLTEKCAPGLQCVHFKYGSACLESCSKSQPNCSHESYKCLISEDSPYGACFRSPKEGEACVDADSAWCDTDTPNNPKRSCLIFGYNPDNPQASGTFETKEDAKCYTKCALKEHPARYCSANQRCVVVNQGDPWGACWPPKKVPRLRDIGEECETNEDCKTDFCKEKDGLRACSAYCDLGTRTGCPRDPASSCLNLDDLRGYCWPNEGPLKVAEEQPPETAGCGCTVNRPSKGLSGVTNWLLVTSFLFLSWFWLRSRQRHKGESG